MLATLQRRGKPLLLADAFTCGCSEQRARLGPLTKLLNGQSFSVQCVDFLMTTSPYPNLIHE